MYDEVCWHEGKLSLLQLIWLETDFRQPQELIRLDGSNHTFIKRLIISLSPCNSNDNVLNREGYKPIYLTLL